MTVHVLPRVLADGQLLDPARIVLPLEYGYGRESATQQPDPGGLQFDWIGAPPFQIGAQLEVWLEDRRLWHGEVTANPATWELPTREAVHSITATGLAYRTARTYARDETWISSGTEAQQVAAVLAAFDSASDPQDPPITVEAVTSPAILQGWRVSLADPLMQTLGELGASTGATVWEDADGVHYVGAAAREYAPEPTQQLPAELLEMPVEYTETAVLNRVTLTYALRAQDSDGATMGEWQWREGTATPAAGQCYWNAALQQLSIHEVDNNGTNQRLNLLNAVEGTGLFVLSPVELRRLSGLVNARTITGQIFRWQLQDAEAGALGLPTNNAVCSAASGAPSGQSLLVVDDTASQGTFGVQEVSLETRYADTAGAGPRANRLLNRWRRPRWAQQLTVNLQLPSTRQLFDAVLHAQPNDGWIIDGLADNEVGAGAGAPVFLEGCIHSWDRSETGAPIARVTWGTSPRRVWTQLQGYGLGPYGHGPYGGIER